jgi:8-oxo-dGTP pyrophosphatase MutT (NUDIX family)
VFGQADDREGDAATPDVTCRSSRIAYENPWMTLTEDEVEYRDGSTGLFAVVRTRDFSLIIPFDGERFTLVEQFRYTVGRRLWEFPQGSVASPADLSAVEVAAIELEEEAGLQAQDWTHLGRLHAGYGRSSTAFDVYLAEVLSSVPTRREGTEQDMRSGSFTWGELWSLVDEGLLTDSHSLAALALLERHRGQALG